MDYQNPAVPQIVILCALLSAKDDSQRVQKLQSLVSGFNALNHEIELYKNTQADLLVKAKKIGLSSEEKETLVQVSITLKRKVAKLHAFLKGCRVTVQKNWKGKI